MVEFEGQCNAALRLSQQNGIPLRGQRWLHGSYFAFTKRYASFSSTAALTQSNQMTGHGIGMIMSGRDGLGVYGAKMGESVTIRILMNKATADSGTPDDDPRCVAAFSLVWNGQPFNEARIIELTKARSLGGDGDVTLSVVAPGGRKLWFDGLYLVLLAKA